MYYSPPHPHPVSCVASTMCAVQPTPTPRESGANPPPCIQHVACGDCALRLALQPACIPVFTCVSLSFCALHCRCYELSRGFPASRTRHWSTCNRQPCPPSNLCMDSNVDAFVTSASIGSKIRLNEARELRLDPKNL